LQVEDNKLILSLNGDGVPGILVPTSNVNPGLVFGAFPTRALSTANQPSAGTAGVYYDTDPSAGGGWYPANVAAFDSGTRTPEDATALLSQTYSDSFASVGIPYDAGPGFSFDSYLRLIFPRR
jgi:hypothetical protein